MIIYNACICNIKIPLYGLFLLICIFTPLLSVPVQKETPVSSAERGRCSADLTGVEVTVITVPGTVRSNNNGLRCPAAGQQSSSLRFLLSWPA